jgi:eukaryotic-like serine/threonine-protein kinase
MASCPKCNKTYADTETTCPDDAAVLVPDAYLKADRDLARGDTVGEYVVEGKIGSGTFGDVYRAVQPLIGKQVAIKILSRRYSADPHIVSRFIAEARAVNQIRHKHIIDIFSFGQLPDGRHYHIMELLQGTTLDRHLKQRGQLAPKETIQILQGLARALDAAHAAGIAHRDLKPANVFLAWDDDQRPFPKLLDFGIAKLLSDDVPRHHQTATGAAVGTPDYMSPEQCQGPNVDHRTDIYAFGVMTYQLLTGRLPFAGTNVVEVLVKQMTAMAAPPSSIAAALPAGLDAPILWMLEKKKEDRPPNLATAVRALEQAALEAGIDVPPSASTGDPSATPPLGLTPRIAVPQVVYDHLKSSGSRPAVEDPRSATVSASFSESVLGDTLPSAARGASDSAPVRADKPAGGKRITLLVAALGVLSAIPAFVLVSKFQSRGEAARAPEQVDVAARAVEASTPQGGEVAAIALAQERAESSTAARAVQPGAATESDEDDHPTVALRVNSEPKGVQIFASGGILLGTAPCAVKLIRGRDPIKLEFRAAGYQPLTREINGQIDVALKKKPAIKPIKKKPKSDDIEDAFQ